MKKFTDLITNMNVESTTNLALINVTNVSHLARNPVVGGRPLSLARMRTVLHGDKVCPLSLLVAFLFDLYRSVMAVRTLIQYNVMKIISVFRLIIAAVSIQPRLNTEERAMIMCILFVVIWVTLPIRVLKITPAIIIGLYININKYTGANFCQVIRSVALTVLDFLTTLRNHLWNGADASFTSKDKVPMTRRILLRELRYMDMCRIRMAEATDWIVKYFIEDSRNVLGAKNLLLINEVQNARVPVSRAIQITIHEDLIKHTTDEMKTVIITTGRILILPILEILNCKFRKMQNLLCAFLRFEDGRFRLT